MTGTAWAIATSRWIDRGARSYASGWPRQHYTLPVDWRAIAVVAHVLAAFWFVAGYVGTNVLTEIARRAQSHQARVAAIGLSDQFDRWLYQRGGTAVLATGLLSWWVFGYPLTTPWILASIALIIGIALLTGFYWRSYGLRVNAAIAAGDPSATQAILNEPRAVLFSRIENLAVLAVIVIMVLRPG
jgi:uncharacterized membrane protein